MQGPRKTATPPKGPRSGAAAPALVARSRARGHRAHRAGYSRTSALAAAGTLRPVRQERADRAAAAGRGLGRGLGSNHRSAPSIGVGSAAAQDRLNVAAAASKEGGTNKKIDATAVAAAAASRRKKMVPLRTAQLKNQDGGGGGGGGGGGQRTARLAGGPAFLNLILTLSLNCNPFVPWIAKAADVRSARVSTNHAFSIMVIDRNNKKKA